MRTQMMNNRQPEMPWFDYYQVGGSRPVRQDIGSLPYIIGRDEDADFPVDSGRVSRNHVLIDRDPDGYVIRDLQSTNGTYVNGKKVNEIELNDGDVVVIADFEFTFFSGRAAARASATQVMTQPAEGHSGGATDLVLQVRRIHETLTHRSVPCLFQAIVELSTGDTYGYEALREIDVQPARNRQAESIIAGTECRLTERISQQHRLVAAEQARQLDEDLRLFFALQVSEVSADFLPETLSRLSTILGQRHQIVAEIPETAVCDIPYFRQFLEQLRERNIEVAYSRFASGPAQVGEWTNIRPDYLKLMPATVQGISRASDGWRHLQSVIQAVGELQCSTIAAGVTDDADAECLRELGCVYGQGSRYGEPMEMVEIMGPRPELATARG